MSSSKLITRLISKRPVRGVTVLGTLRPWGVIRYISQPAVEPKATSQPTNAPSMPTKDRLWQRLSEVENRFGDLMKESYEREMVSRMSWEKIKAGQELIGWHVSGFFAAGIVAFTAGIGVLVYFVDKWEKHFPAAVVGVLVEKNLVLNTPPLNPPNAPSLPSNTPNK